jgi:hypothetical protein
MSELTGLFGELIYILHKSVSDDEARREVYEHMVDAFNEVDETEYDDCLGSDPVFDKIIKDRFEEDPVEAEEEWEE